MPATSGPTLPRQFAFYDPDESCWRTWPAIGLWGSDEFLETWPPSGMTADGRAFELPTSVPATNESGCSSLLPTPTARDGKGVSLPSRTGGKALPDVLKLLPTPTAADSVRGPDYARAGRVGSGGDDLVTLLARLKTGRLRLLPKPAAQEPGGTLERYHERLSQHDSRTSTFVPLGMLVQSWATTSPPSDSGSTSPDPPPTPPDPEDTLFGSSG